MSPLMSPGEFGEAWGVLRCHVPVPNVPNDPNDVPNFHHDVPNVPQDVPNFHHDVPNVPHEVPNVLHDVPNVLHNVPNIPRGAQGSVGGSEVPHPCPQ